MWKHGSLITKIMASALCFALFMVLSGCQATHMAVMNGDINAFQVALDKGADVNEIGRITKGTPLWRAACSGHVDMVRFLLSRGADPNAGKHKPLDCAANDGNPTIVTLLLENGAVPTEAAMKSANAKGYSTVAAIIKEAQTKYLGESYSTANQETNRVLTKRETIDEKAIEADKENNFIKTKLPPHAAIGKNYALVIGNNNYRLFPVLKTARHDAQTVANILQKNYGFQVRLLLDARRADIIAAMTKYRESLTKQDNLLIFYAGHGWLDKVGDEGYWLPVDATKDNEINWISNASITTQLKAMEANHVLIVADSCFSGKLGRSVHIQKRTPDYYSRIAKKRARSVIASGGLEPVIDGGGKGNHSVFAAAFIEALQENKETMDSSELFNKIKRPVVLNADQIPEYSDIRKAGHDGGEFIFIRKK